MTPFSFLSNNSSSPSPTSYWVWIYWFNSFSWALRGLAVNQFASGKYDEPSQVPGLTTGEAILTQFGFVDGDGKAYEFEWAWWAIIYSFSVGVLSIIIGSISYSVIRYATGKSLPGGNMLEDDDTDDFEEDDNKKETKLPFQKVNLTFKDVHYFVSSSVGNEKLELLKGVDGVVEAGKMTALMGSSGAGKTTVSER